MSDGADTWRDGWLWVSTPRATFRLEARDGRIVDAAPYARKRTLGRTVEEALEIWHGARFEWFPE